VSRIVRKRVFGVEIEAHPVVFPAAAILIVTFVVATAWMPGRALILFGWLQDEIASRFAWLYIIAMTGFLVFAIFLCVSRYGKIRLGPDDVAPEFSTLTWFSMLFSAGMGIGMLFFGVAEPMWHYLAPPTGEGETLEAARQAMGITLFHWCLHPWSLYALVALALAYFGFRRGLPLSFRSVFYPLLGERIHGPIGNAIDIMAVLATLFGLATSLGLGAMQVNAGLNYVFGLPQGIGIQVVIIACITALAVVSLVSGLHVGIRRLSEANMCMAGVLLLFLFVAGPTRYLLETLVENVGAYFQRLPHNSFRTGVYDSRSTVSWLNSWTVFYWGWWIAWSPFVGMFIARVSKGRTIREFIIGVLLVPSAVATLWMTGFGNTALHQEIYRQVSDDPAVVESAYSYEPRDYEVQVLDEASGLPRAEDGQWLVGPHARAAATPIGVLMKQHGDSFLTKSAAEVEYHRGVLVHRGTRRPFHPDDDSRHTGAYQSKTDELTLGGYLTSPVLTEDRSRRVDTTATAMFVMLEAYPLSTLTALIGTLCVVLFFVTSSDSASMVADIIASGGSENPTTGTRLFWGILEGVLAAVLLLAGGLKALQTASITIALPFCVIVIAMCFSLYRGLKSELDGDAEEE
jgi:choline/glycine/proline betaine transport protein